MHAYMYVCNRLKPKAHQAQAQSTSGSSPKHIRLKPKAHQAQAQSTSGSQYTEEPQKSMFDTSVHTYIHIHKRTYLHTYTRKGGMHVPVQFLSRPT